MGKNNQSDKNLEQKYLDTVMRLVDELERISAKLDRNVVKLPFSATPCLSSRVA